ncbi:MAG TPA: type II secretion system protein GspC [Sandaracinaceae bacterium LLY-WYZ-13_1]|nr:type II secretion system protein GspC [Sandaracinaceae bacterium LLY-WYZ-13_1]
MATSSRQRRIVAAILLSTLGLTGVMVAQGGTQLIASSAMPLDPSAFSPGPLGNVRPAPREEVDATPILRRNIFDHETGRLDVLPEPEVEEEPQEEPQEELDPNAPPPACDGSMRLVGAFVRMRRPEDSFAAITDSTGEALLYQSGMDVDDREIVAIQHNRVILRPRDGSLCSLSMFSEEEAPRVATRARPVTPSRPRARSRRPTGTPEGLDPDDLESGIDQVSENEYTIDRGLVNRLLANQAALMRTARVIPHEEGGRVVGVKLYGIRRSSLLGRLGIQNGDMLSTINGYDMTSPDSALEAYARLRNADRITINLQRRGSDQTIDYRIQ